MVKKIFLSLIIIVFVGKLSAQQSFLTRSDTLNKKRVKLLNLGCGIGYSSSMYGLNTLWYNQYPRSKFHFFDDRREWLDMDKFGHTLVAYQVANILTSSYQWTGMSKRKSMWHAVFWSTLFQTTIETFDGFSAEWGFSLGDFASNTTGTGLAIVQELIWKEQKILFKASSTPKNYPNTPITSTDGLHTTTLSTRTTDLFGTIYPQTFFKDYNAATYWASFNINSLTGNKKFIPNWLNIAIGYSTENVFGGYSNQWKGKSGETYVLDANLYPRYRQYFLSLDIDLSRIKTKSKFLNSALRFVSWVKVPAPALEFSQGKFQFKPLMF
jgi:Predicted periplasmic lipoprotein (DUF2279)